MEDIAIQLVHGRTKHTVQINPMLPLRSLMDKVEELTGIPQSGQKLICQGQTLTSQACVLLIYSCCIFQICSCTVLLLLKMITPFVFLYYFGLIDNNISTSDGYQPVPTFNYVHRNTC